MPSPIVTLQGPSKRRCAFWVSKCGDDAPAVFSRGSAQVFSSGKWLISAVSDEEEKCEDLGSTVIVVAAQGPGAPPHTTQLVRSVALERGIWAGTASWEHPYSCTATLNTPMYTCDVLSAKREPLNSTPVVLPVPSGSWDAPDGQTFDPEGFSKMWPTGYLAWPATVTSAHRGLPELASHVVDPLYANAIRAYAEAQFPDVALPRAVTGIVARHSRYAPEVSDDTKTALAMRNRGEDCDGLALHGASVLRALGMRAGFAVGVARLKGGIMGHAWACVLGPRFPGDGTDVMHCEATGLDRHGARHILLVAFVFTEDCAYAAVPTSGDRAGRLGADPREPHAYVAVEGDVSSVTPRECVHTFSELRANAPSEGSSPFGWFLRGPSQSFVKTDRSAGALSQR